MSIILNRLPKLNQIAPVYAVIVMMVYSWTILWYLWKFPSWMHFLSPADILSIFAYALAANFLESLAILLLVLALCLLLPAKWFFDSFVVRGATLAMLFLSYLMYFSYSFQTIEADDYPKLLADWTPAVIILIIVVVFIVGRISFLSRAVEELSTRAVIFLYISMPISIIALLYVAARNRLWEL